MYASFESNELISISGLKNPSAFFNRLNKLLADNEAIIGLGCFAPSYEVGIWLKSLPSIEISKKYDFRNSCELARENPQGGAFYLKATPFNLIELSRLGASVSSPEFLCSHVIGFKQETSLFSFHDAFSYDDMLASPNISRENIEMFCAALGVKYKLIQNPQQRHGRS